MQYNEQKKFSKVVGGSHSIAQKIWFSLSILIVGYLFSMVFGFYLGHQIESRLLQVSEQQFPVAQKSHAAQNGFKEQVRLYYDAVTTGDTELINDAEAKAEEVQQLLGDIANLMPLEDQRRNDVLKTRHLLKAFTTQARIGVHPVEHGSR